MTRPGVLGFVGLLCCWAFLVHCTAAFRRVHVDSTGNAAVALRKACTVPFAAKTVDVGGSLGWALGMNATWQQPKIYAGDKLRFSWPFPPSEGGPNPVAEHNVFKMSNKKEFDRCTFRNSNELSERSPYTTPKLASAGVYYYGCEEGRHCAKGQKVAIVVSKAPKRLPCPPPPPPLVANGLVYIGTSPYYWTLDMSKWRQPKVVRGNTLVFIWDKNTASPPHDVQIFKSKKASDACDFTGGKVIGQLKDRSEARYKVTEKAGSTIYFGCGYDFHCVVGMKVAIKVSA